MNIFTPSPSNRTSCRRPMIGAAIALADRHRWCTMEPELNDAPMPGD